MSAISLLAGPVLLGAAIGWWLRARAGRKSPPPRPCRVARDALPESGKAGSGLAVFYAYQMAARRIERPAGG